MRVFFIIFLSLIYFKVNCQIHELNDYLKLKRNVTYSKIDFTLLKKRITMNGNELDCFDFSNTKIKDFVFIPPQLNLRCGYYISKEKVYNLGFGEKNLGCDLDMTSIEMFILELKTKRYLLVNSTSPYNTKRVFHLVINLDNENEWFNLSSIYGKENNFGDFNLDGKLDFIEVEYDKFDPKFKASFYTLNEGVKESQKKSYQLQRLLEDNVIKFEIIK